MRCFGADGQVWGRASVVESDAAAGGRPRTWGLTGWPTRVGDVLVSAGIAACALLAWYGVSCILAAM